MNKTSLERFELIGWQIDKNNCWNWNGFVFPSGYAGFAFDNTSRASRASYQIHKGPIPDKMLVRHTCDNKLCVNPNHLILGTHMDNMADRNRRNRTSKGHTHYESRFTSDEIISIRNSNDSYGTLAAKYGVSRQAIYKIKKHKSYK